ACNYLPYARVLSTGWRRAHPEAPFRVLLLDGDPSAAPELDVMTCAGLGISGPGELNSAIKPYLLRALLADGHSPVLFLDSDTEVHAPLDDIARQVER